MKIRSLRQSKQWGAFLKSLGWEVIDTSFGAQIFFLKSVFGTICKIQKPEKFNADGLSEIEKLASKRKAIFIKIEPGYGQDAKVLQDKGFVKSKFPLSPPSTLFIDLTKSEDEMWSDLSRSAKYSIRRAKREENYFKAYQNPDNEILQRLQDISKVTSKKSKFYLPPIKELTLKKNAFGEGTFVTEVYDKNDALVSGKFFVADQEMITYLQGGTSEIGRKGKGGYLLLWESMLYFKKLGYKTLDLEGVDDARFPQFTKNWGGFSHFKEKFGGKIVRFPVPYIKYYNPILKFVSKYQEIPL